MRGALETLDENLEVPYRRDEVAPPVICLVPQSIVLVAQGAKQMWAGGEGFPYDTGRFLVTSLDLPANSEVTLGSPEQPCLGLSATSWPCGSGRWCPDAGRGRRYLTEHHPHLGQQLGAGGGRRVAVTAQVTVCRQRLGCGQIPCPLAP